MVVSAKFVEDYYEDITAALERGEVVEMLVPDKAPLRVVHSDSPKLNEQKSRILGAGTAKDVGLYILDNWDELDKEWRASYRDSFGLDEE